MYWNRQRAGVTCTWTASTTSAHQTIRG
jgi:hypothetical protein